MQQLQHETLQTEWDENRNQNGLDTMAKAVGRGGGAHATGLLSHDACVLYECCAHRHRALNAVATVKSGLCRGGDQLTAHLLPIPFLNRREGALREQVFDHNSRCFGEGRNESVPRKECSQRGLNVGRPLHLTAIHARGQGRYSRDPSGKSRASW